MIKVKTDSDSTKDIEGVLVKTATNALTKVAKGYQMVSVNGVPALIPVFLSECKHDYVIEHEYQPTCYDAGYNLYKCKICGDTYEADFVDSEGHSYEPDTGTCTKCGEPCGHFDADNETLENQWTNESGYCKNCGYAVWA